MSMTCFIFELIVIIVFILLNILIYGIFNAVTFSGLYILGKTSGSVYCVSGLIIDRLIVCFFNFQLV